jgi:hypothetical protein
MTVDPLPSNSPPPKPRSRSRSLKHGYYASLFDPEEIADLADIKRYDFDAEIGLMRVLTRQLLESSNQRRDFATLMDLLERVSQSSLAFARLLHTRLIIHGEPPGMNETLTEAIRQTLEEFAAENRANAEARSAGLPEPYPVGERIGHF